MLYSQFWLCNFGGAAILASVMMTLSSFVGRIILLHQLVEPMAQFGIVALVLLIAWTVILWWLDRRNQKFPSLRSKIITY